MADLISKKDNLNTGRGKLNKAIADSETALNTANEANEKSDDTQAQLNNVVVEGDSSPAADQARYNSVTDINHDTLADRLDNEYNEVTTELAETHKQPSDYGAIGDGVNDDTLALQEWATDTAFKNKFLPQGKTFRTTETITINMDNINLLAYGSIIKPDSDVLIGCIIGGFTDTNPPTRMNIEGLKVSRDSYDGTTENIGIKFIECNQSMFTNLESRNSKYNYVFEPNTGGIAYNVFNNLQAIGGFYNFYLNALASGWCNENNFFGGRGFCTINTNTNWYVEGNAGQNGHNKVYGISLEGQGEQGIYDNAKWNLYDHPRLEGTWSSGFGCVFGVDSDGLEIISNRYDTIVSDQSTLQRNIINTYAQGVKRHTIRNNETNAHFVREGANTEDIALMILEDLYSGSGNPYILEFLHERENSDSFVFKSKKKSTGALKSSLTVDGRLQLARQIKVDTSGWNFEPFSLGNHRIWVTSDNVIMHKSGAPTSETDGNVLGEGYRDYSGNPNGFLTPKYIGDMVRDTSNEIWYKAFDLTKDKWKPLNV